MKNPIVSKIQNADWRKWLPELTEGQINMLEAWLAQMLSNEYKRGVAEGRSAQALDTDLRFEEAVGSDDPKGDIRNRWYAGTPQAEIEKE